MEAAAVQRQTPVTLEDYFALERTSEVRHEYHGHGRIVAMAGGSANHATIGLNFAAEMRARLPRTCRSFGSDMRVKVQANGRFFYPDASALCGQTELVGDGGLESLTNPQLIVEVVSPSTERIDRLEKFDAYTTIETLQAYVLAEQHEPRLTLITRAADGGWRIDKVVGLTETFRLPALDLEIPMAAIYRDVTFPPPAPPVGEPVVSPAPSEAPRS